MTGEVSQDEVNGSFGEPVRTWPDYVVALLGSIVGGYMLSAVIANFGIGLMGRSLVLAIVGPIVVIPFGSALGTTGALALFGRHSPVVTGLLTLPITVGVWVAVSGLISFVDTMDYGWLAVVPPVAAPLLARFIVRGREPPPSARRQRAPFRDWPLGRFIRYGLLALLGSLLVWFGINWIGRDNSSSVAFNPQGPRVCECDRLEDWVESLVIAPDGSTTFRASNIRSAELRDGFVVVSNQFPGIVIDTAYFWNAFADAGFNAVQILDEVDQWSATFFDGDTRSESPWVVDVTLLEYEIEMTIRVRVEGSEWGIGSTDEMWGLYLADREAGLDVQMERQLRAIDILEPVERALPGVSEAEARGG